jgi:hypothetical protein
MRKVLWVVSVGLCLVSSTALAKERGGIRMADTVTVEGKTLKLQGVGLRSKFVFKVYAAGLYLENPAADSAAILASDDIRRVHLYMLRNVSKEQISEAISEGFAKNSKAQMPALKERLNKFIAALPDLKAKDELIFTALPGKGLTISGKASTVIDGKDFADALFAVWLGKEPVDETLKKQMLGGE